ncbi:serine/threonine protein kinase [Phytophthora nicotianae CJ01A1]|uniref:Serine/threonine protein kinase n=6 Tax=Phytophthora nicotianae TaxID=4792 RepID=W2QVH3_PHYN3|nr:serine/threonine protein kinase [Phytophthora nicotianae INRA-310]ETI32946.1 serine/threonine protein kinase [Phytophthora nicotianae P1569]ETK73292.1 serine/threonine protein kinase [Phytophthora nicotianae]ETO61685.1 serine/threonine protein kinase [Phytophthora nicotianae P1976]ETP02780.1 serine/threonine protein kinase [Phytophthora nicotianae CJ01A1]ETP30942.1 serine/threonine protein kinase [Phytophthora nicotianae P10297]KUF82101.1 kinase protein [Phytophthora nicotianae]
MGNRLSSIVDSVLYYLDDLSDKLPLRSLLKWRSDSKKQLFQEKLQPHMAAGVRHKSVVRVTSLEATGPNDIPRIFTTPRSLNVEWNLCDKVDPARRVDVVSDHKLLRKRRKGLFVDKNTRLQVHCDTRTLAQNELEIMCYIANYCETYKQPIHRNIVHLLGYYSANDTLHEIIEFCELGSLMNAYIESPQEGLRLTFSPSEGEVCDAMFQICSGLHFLHENGVAHGNLGLENIFVTSENFLKIGDFEHSVFVGSDNQHQSLSKLPPPALKTYIAPEIEAFKPGERLDLQKADVWSMGIIFILLLTKKPLFDAARSDDNGFQMFCRVGLRSYLKVMYLEQSAICKLSDELLEFAEGLLNLNPSLRFTMREALNAKWLKNEKSSGRLLVRADSFAVASFHADAVAAHLVRQDTRKKSE